MIRIENPEYPISVNLDNARTQYYSNYAVVFPDAETRLAHAQGLVPTDGSESRPNPNLTWSLLASHWADPDDNAFELAWRMFNLRKAMRRYRGETVLRLSGFVPRQIIPETGKLPADISIELGTLYPSLEQSAPDGVGARYRFARPATQKLPERLRDVPLMNMIVGMQTTTQQEISTNGESEISVTPYVDYSPTSTVTAFSGRVCLTDSYELYRGNSASRFHHLLFGNNHAYNLISAVVKTIGGEPLRRFDEQVDAGHIRSNKPLPDLEFLAAA
jgi:hypothetical protein